MPSMSRHPQLGAEHNALVMRKGFSGVPLTQRLNTIPGWKFKRSVPPVGGFPLQKGGHTGEWWINELYAKAIANPLFPSAPR